LALLVAIAAALSLSGLSAWLLTRRAVRPLERSLARLRQFSLDASHELRGPLAALAANAEMGLLDLDQASPGPGLAVQRRRFEAIASATDQMEQLVDDLLLLARQDEQRLDAPRPVALSALLAQQLDLLRDAFALKGLQLKSQISDDLTVLGQPPLLQRLFRNLLDNALAYTPAGGQVCVEAYLKGSHVVVAVHDTGIGLAPEQLSQVFDRFWRASSDRTQRGSGLGLAIASRICLSHGGSIRASSVPDQGSCFVVELPVMATGWSASAW
jgi:signal transduction histidine kinase